MSISIFVTGDIVPSPAVLALVCDRQPCSGNETFIYLDGYIRSHALAMAAGWLERQTSQGRLWLCPACSGKQAALARVAQR